MRRMKTTDDSLQIAYRNISKTLYSLLPGLKHDFPHQSSHTHRLNAPLHWESRLHFLRHLRSLEILLRSLLQIYAATSGNVFISKFFNSLGFSDTCAIRNRPGPPSSLQTGNAWLSNSLEPGIACEVCHCTNSMRRSWWYSDVSVTYGINIRAADF